MADTQSKKIEAPVLGKSGTISLDPGIFAEEFNGALVHEVVRAERNAKRSGTASTKSRGEVAMTGAKAWRQKGTGRARIGAHSTGHRRGGGVIFGPTPRHYTFKVNRKARRKALRAALSLHAERGSLAIVEPGAFSEPNTNQAAGHLNGWRADGSVVLLTAGSDERTLALSFRNIGRVRAVLTPEQLGVYEITAAQNLVISQDALESLSNLAKTEVDRSSKKPVIAVPTKGSAAPRAKGAKPAPKATAEVDSADQSEASVPGEVLPDAVTADAATPDAATSDDGANSESEATE